MNNQISIQQNQFKTISELKKDRVSNTITREEYWLKISERLEFTKDLIDVSTREKLNFFINSNGIELEIPLGEYGKTVRMILDIHDLRSAPFTIIAEGPYERFQAEILFSLGMVSRNFIDAGANMGYYSLALGLLNPKIAVQSFEPQPKIFNLFSENIKLNKLQNQLVAHNCGLGSVVENLELHIPKFTGSGGGSFANQHAEEGESGKVNVDVRILDDLLTTNFLADLIKIDIEGYELEMIKGSIGIISNSKPTIVVELLRKWMKSFGNHPQDVLNLLVPLGYKVFGIGPDTIFEINEINEETTETNFIFIHELNQVHFKILERYIKS